MWYNHHIPTLTDTEMAYSDIDLITRLQVRASIRRSIQTRKSVQEGKPDRIADLLEEAAVVIYEDQRFKNSWFYKVWKFFNSL